MEMLSIYYLQHLVANMLKDKTVLVVGCGGLGGYVIQQLGRMNVGKLIIMDGDVFEPSNMNRQLLCSTTTLGKKKAEVYGEFLKTISSAEVEVYTDRFDSSNADLVNLADVVIDCVDTVGVRKFLAEECRKRGKILIHGAVDGETGQAMICYPDSPGLIGLYEDVDEVTHKTISFNVGLVASLETMLAYRVLMGEDDEYKGKIILIDLPSALIKVMDI